MNADGTYDYRPDHNFSGTDIFTYEICDDTGACATATVTIEVRDSISNPGNTSPVANDDTASGLVGQPISGSLLTNDGDPDGDLVTLNTTPVSGPTNGTVTINADGTFVYTPNPGFIGFDSFEYEICDGAGNCDTAVVTLGISPDVNGSDNNVPAANDDAGIGQKNDPVTGDLLANDSDPNGDPLIINTTPVVVPNHGTLIINPDGSYLYTPDPDFVGTDSFVYEVCDGNGGCEQATVYLTVFDNPPIATNDILTVTSDTPASENVLTNDYDPNTNDDLVVTSVDGQPVGTPIVTAHGTLVMQADGSYTYSPNTDANATEVFTYRVCDEGGNCAFAQLTIIVRNTEATDQNAPPIASNDTATAFVNQSVRGSLTSNDGDPNGDAIRIITNPVSRPSHGVVVINSDGTFVYTTNRGFVGVDTFEYQICDQFGGCDTAIATIRVVGDPNGALNDAPVAGDDAVFTTKGVPVSCRPTER